MRALQKSTGKTAAEIEKMLEQGQLTAEYIKPFINAMGELASANGAYEKALLKLGTVENRMKTNAGLAAARMGEAGFTKGLVHLYTELIRVFQENDHAIVELGKAFEVFFKGVSVMIRFFEPLLQAVSRAFGSLARTVEYLNDKLGTGPAGLLGTLTFLGTLLKVMPEPIRKFGLAFAKALAIPLAKMYLFIGLIDEIRGFFDDDMIGLFDNENWTTEQRKEVKKRRREGDFFYNPDMAIVTGGLDKTTDLSKMSPEERSEVLKQEYINVTKRKANEWKAEGKYARAMLIDNFFTNWVAGFTSSFEADFYNRVYNISDFKARMEKMQNMQQPQSTPSNTTNQNTITINVDGSKDPKAVSSQIERDLTKALGLNAAMGVR